MTEKLVFGFLLKRSLVLWTFTKVNAIPLKLSLFNLNIFRIKPKFEHAGATTPAGASGGSGGETPQGTAATNAPANFVKSDKTRLNCTFCKKRGHLEKNCFKKDPSKKAEFKSAKSVKKVMIKSCLLLRRL